MTNLLSLSLSALLDKADAEYRICSKISRFFRLCYVSEQPFIRKITYELFFAPHTAPSKIFSAFLLLFVRLPFCA